MNKYFVHRKFSEVAAQYPDNIAIEDSSRTINYAQLDACSNQIAHALNDKPKHSHPVALFLPKSIEYIMSALAVLKSDQAFLPLSPDLPAQRLKDILDKAAPDVIVTTPALVDALQTTLSNLDYESAAIELVEFDTDKGVDSNQPSSAPEMHGDPDDDNYIMFTSGTTGKPKAIVGRHKSLSHFIHWEMKEFDLPGKQFRVSQLAPPTFDVSLRDIFSALLSGGTCCIPDPEVQFDARRLLNWLIEKHINFIHCVPSIFRLLMTEIEALQQTPEQNASAFSQLRHILLAGEPLLGRDVNRWIDTVGTQVELVNLYGPSETTLAKLFYRIPGKVENVNQVMPIGHPISNAAALIIKDGRLCRVGEIGEIYIKTPFRSKGYLNDAALTTASFIQNPLAPADSGEDIIYKTGDLGRYQPDHCVEVLGRLDRQVKLNGIRVELNDIEGHILDLPALDQCFLKMHTDKAQQNMLVCYYTSKEELTPADIKQQLSDKLPANLIPTLLIKLERFPLMLNGKVDKKALPNPEAYIESVADTAQAETEQDLSETESTLLQIWQKSLGLARISLNHKFFDLGGTSLSVMKVLGEVFRALQVEISIQDFYQYDTITKLSVFIDIQRNQLNKAEASDSSKATLSKYTDIPKAPQQKTYPLTLAQTNLWISETFAQENAAFTIPGAWKMSGSLNQDALKQAVAQLQARHDILRMSIGADDNNTPFWQYHDSVELPLTVTHLADADNAKAQAMELMQEDAGKAFDLSEGPLLRLQLFEMPEQAGKPQAILYYCFHHVIADAWSVGVFAEELMAMYHANCQQKAPELADLSVNYRDFAHWQQQPSQVEQRQAQQAYWTENFANKIPVLTLPTDFVRPAEKAYQGEQHRFVLNAELTAKINRYASEQQTSVFALLMATYQLLLSKYSTQEEVVTGFPCAGREHPDLGGLLGMFINTLPLRNRCKVDMSFAEYLTNTGTQINAALDHQSYPLDALIKDVDLERDMSRSPLFDTLLVLQNFAEPQVNTDVLRCEIVELAQTAAWYDLTLNWMQADGQLRCKVIYDKALFKPETIARLGEHFTVLLSQALQSPNTPLGQLSLLSAPEIKQLNTEFNAPMVGEAASEGQKENIVQRFEHWAATTPDSTAVSYFEQRLSFRELNEKANQLARFMQSNGVATGDIVATHLPRGPLLIISMLATLKAGAVYLPIDVGYPQSRKAYLLQDSGVTQVITTAEEQNFSGVKTLVVNEPDLANFDRSNLGRYSQPDTLAYMIYTSGSTGNPKGTLGHHKGVINLSAHFGDFLTLTANDNFLQFANCAFDASIFESFIALLNGVSLVMVSDEIIAEVEDFTAYLQQQQVTVTVLPPTYVRQLTPSQLTCLRVLMTAGSATDLSLAQAWVDQVRYINAYGPTETTVCASAYEVTRSALETIKAEQRPIPIGKPLRNFRLDVMDENQQLMPIGVPGELCISGIGVALGYHNRPEKTAECFVPNPHHPSLPMYRTGDLARWLPDGSIEFLGRKDDQVKVRGFRIELAEIDYHLQAISSIDDGLVLVVGDNDDAQLVAFYVGSPDVQESLRTQLQTELPHYMVPAKFVALDEFPLTPNGKVDKAALRERVTVATSSTEQTASAQNVQAVISQVWCKLLGVTKIAETDKFTALGGDSIKAIQTVAELKKRGLLVKASHVLQYPTISALSEQVTVADTAEYKTVSGEFRLTPIQSWFFNHYAGNKQKFFQSTFLEFNEGLDAAAMQRTLQAVINHHDALRSIFSIDEANKTANANIAPAGVLFDVHSINLTSNDDMAMQPHVAALTEQQWLQRDALIQAVIFNRPDQSAVLFLLAHHLVVDTVSWWILIEDIEHGYQAAKSGEPIALPSKTSAYIDWANALQARRKQLASQTDTQWQGLSRQLNESFKLPAAQQAEASDKNASLQYAFSIGETNGLRQADASMQHLLMALHVRAMQAQFGEQQFATMLEHHGREDCFDNVNVSRTVGWFTSMTPVLAQPTAQSTLLSLTEELATQLKALAHNGLDFGIATGFEQQADVSLNYLGEISTQRALIDVDFAQLQQPLQHSIAISAFIQNRQLVVNLAYKPECFTPEQANAWLENVQHQVAEYVGSLNTTSAAQSAERKKRLHEAMPSLLDKFGLPGLAVGMSSNLDEPELTPIVEICGESSSDTHAPLALDQQFNIGSLTKTFTSTLALMLVDEGKLQLEQPIGTLLSSEQLNSVNIQEGVTIKQLLNHTSGIRDFMKNPQFKTAIAKDPTKIWQPEDVLTYCQGHEFDAGASGQWLYSSTGYVLLGMAIEKATGQTLYDALQQRILEPLQLQQTGMSRGGKLPVSLATGHCLQGKSVAEHSLSFGWAAGDMYSDIGDMLKWTRVYLNGDLLSEKLRAARTQFVTLPEQASLQQRVAVGLGIFSIEGYIGHLGDINGFEAGILANEHGQVVMLTNGETEQAAMLFEGSLMHHLCRIV